MNVKSFKKGAVIFRQGDAGDCMYDIQFGKVGIFDHYGEPDEKKIADLYADQIFGEMGLLDHAPRNATAVVLENETVLSVISEEEFLSTFGVPVSDIYGEVIKRHIEDGTLEAAPCGRYRLTPRGIDVSNVVLADFLFE